MKDRISTEGFRQAVGNGEMYLIVFHNEITRRCTILVLSRKKNQRILIPGTDIAITIVEIRGDKVRIGIEAPPEVAIYREEVWEAIQRKEKEGEERNASESPE